MTCGMYYLIKVISIDIYIDRHWHIYIIRHCIATLIMLKYRLFRLVHCNNKIKGNTHILTLFSFGQLLYIGHTLTYQTVTMQ